MEVLCEMLEDGEEEAAAAMAAGTLVKAMVEQEDGNKGSRSGWSENVNRGFARGHHQIVLDYFWPMESLRDDGSNRYGPVFSRKSFERRFRMPRVVFENLFSVVSGNNV